MAGAACGGGGGRSSGSANGELTATLNGSGATFPQAFYETVIEAYRETHPDVRVTYGGGGSGAGRQALADAVVDYAGSDGLVKEEDKPGYKGGEILYLPTIAAPITISYNLDGVDNLVLDASSIAKIFQRQIKRWNDPALKALNPDAALPNRAIVVAHRSDGSGTTENFTKYLVAAAGSDWKLGSGPTVEWPTDTQAGNGNSGVAQIVQDNQGAVGYVDLSDSKASRLQQAKIKNKAGRPVGPTLDGASAALAGATVNPDLTYNPLDAGGDDSYPITAPTWILVYKNQTDAGKARALKSFLGFMLSDGQDLAKEVDYAPLPEDLRMKARAQVDSIVEPAG